MGAGGGHTGMLSFNNRGLSQDGMTTTKNDDWSIDVSKQLLSASSLNPTGELKTKETDLKNSVLCHSVADSQDTGAVFESHIDKTDSSEFRIANFKVFRGKEDSKQNKKKQRPLALSG